MEKRLLTLLVEIGDSDKEASWIWDSIKNKHERCGCKILVIAEGDQICQCEEKDEEIVY